jgi:hypothetical protein
MVGLVASFFGVVLLIFRREITNAIAPSNVATEAEPIRPEVAEVSAADDAARPTAGATLFVWLRTAMLRLGLLAVVVFAATRGLLYLVGRQIVVVVRAARIYARQLDAYATRKIVQRPHLALLYDLLRATAGVAKAWVNDTAAFVRRLMGAK